MKTWVKVVISCIFLMAFYCQAKIHHEVMMVDEASDHLRLKQKMYFLADNAHKLQLVDLLQDSANLNWIYAAGTSADTVNDKPSQWFKITLKNSSNQALQKLLSLNEFTAGALSLYSHIPAGPTITLGENIGVDGDFNLSPRKRDAFLFQLDIPAHSAITLFIHTLSPALEDKNFELFLYDKNSVILTQNNQSLFNGFTYGYFFLTFISCLVGYFLSRDISFLHFALLDFVLLASQFLQLGHAYTVMPEAAAIINGIAYALYPAFILSLCWFASGYNRMHKLMPRIRVAIHAIMIITALGLLFANLFDQPLLAACFTGLYIATVLMLLFTSYRCYRLGNTESLYFFYGLIMLSLSIGLEISTDMGLLETEGVISFLMIAALLSMLCAFSFGLALRYHDLRKQSALLLIERERSLMQAEKAQLSIKRTNQFLATMSHEIRTPINGVLGMAEILSHTPLNVEQQHYNKLVINSGNTLLCIINDILDFSKLQSEKLKLERIGFKSDEVVTNTLALFSPQAQQKNIDLTVFFSPEVPVNLIGDPHRLQQIINNLLSNAIKFTDQGQVEFIMSGQFQADDEFLLKLEVKDSGIGITEQQMANLFNAFEQADTSTSRQYGGTGLGLAISKRLADLMNAEIQVSSKFGEGSCFSVTLPLSIDTDKESTRIQHLSRLAGTRLLLITDSHYYRRHVQAFLKFWDINVSSVSSLEQAKEYLQNSAQSIELTLLLQSNSNTIDIDDIQQVFTADMPIIFVPADYQESELHSFFQQRGTLICKAPTCSQLLDSLVNSLVDAVTTAPVVAAYRSTSTAAESVNTEADYKELKLLVAEDNKTNQVVILAMAKRLGIEITMVENGRQVVETMQTQGGNYHGILMDCEMPEMDGYAAAKAIRKIERNEGRAAIPIVALTAHTLPEHHQRCIDCGIDDMLSKPVSLNSLSMIVEKWFINNQLAIAETG